MPVISFNIPELLGQRILQAFRTTYPDDVVDVNYVKRRIIRFLAQTVKSAELPQVVASYQRQLEDSIDRNVEMIT